MRSRPLVFLPSAARSREMPVSLPSTERDFSTVKALGQNVLEEL